MQDADFVTAFAPASIGNVAVGFDMLGLALAGVGDRVAARRAASPGVRLLEVRTDDGAPHPRLTADAAANTASIAARALWECVGDDGGLELVLSKGVPLRSGMGSSAASAVAAVVAVNALLEAPLEASALLPYALEGEAYASGGHHADNVAPSLLGGLVLCPEVLNPKTICVRVPQGISSVLVHPELEIDTAESRRRLSPTCSMGQWLEQQGLLAGFLLACERGDTALLGQCLRDVIIEPQRVRDVPPFAAMRDAALGASAWGCSLSGSGPSVFALCAEDLAPAVAAAMEGACRAAGLHCRSWISPLDAPGARILRPA
ncbi:MAG: homoserine kinase [Woeseiaceae bacterium]